MSTDTTRIERYLTLAAIQNKTVWEIGASRGREIRRSYIHARDLAEAMREAECTWRSSARGGIWHSYVAREVACPLKPTK